MLETKERRGTHLDSGSGGDVEEESGVGYVNLSAVQETTSDVGVSRLRQASPPKLAEGESAANEIDVEDMCAYDSRILIVPLYSCFWIHYLHFSPSCALEAREKHITTVTS